jgi:hypothetical protein
MFFIEHLPDGIIADGGRRSQRPTCLPPVLQQDQEIGDADIPSNIGDVEAAPRIA